MPLNLDVIFKGHEKSNRGVPSLKVVGGIIGRCWIAPALNREIANEIGVSDSVISEAIKNHLIHSKLIIPYKERPESKRTRYTINFISIIDYFTKISNFQGRKESLLYLIMNNRAAVGKSFLDSLILGDTYQRGLKKMKNLYETTPELLILLILSLDRTATKHSEYITFLRGLYDAILEKLETNEPELLYTWNGLLWFK
ncbi:MAG: hypothetical protein ACTSPV_14295 [Candidatus Hodarchaeales archaeon]